MLHRRLLLSLPLLMLLAGCSNDPAATPPDATRNAPGANSPTQGTPGNAPGNAPGKTPGSSSSAGALKVARQYSSTMKSPG